MSASFRGHLSLAVDGSGNVYVGDSGHGRVRKVTGDGIITTVAGNGSPFGSDGGQATASGLSPAGIALDGGGNLYIVDTGTARIRKVSPGGIISTIAGNGYTSYFGDGGPATLATISNANDVAVDTGGNLYIAESNRIQMVGTNGVINSIAGGTTPSPSVSVTGIASGRNGQIYVAINSGIGLMAATGKTFFPPPMVIAYRTASDFPPISTTLGQGGWVEIIGSYLSSTWRSWASTDFSGINAPISLDGTSVTIGGQPAFISYVSPGQINAQVPTNSGTGRQPMVITTKTGTATTLEPLGIPLGPTINPSAPGLLAPISFPSLVGLGARTLAAVFPDGVTYVLPTGFIPGVPSRPARGGDTITLYGIGFGPVNPSTPAGQIVQASNALQLPLQVYLPSLGNAALSVSYAGMVPGVVGLYQFNVTLPKTIPTPYTLLVVTLEGVTAGGAFLSTQ